MLRLHRILLALLLLAGPAHAGVSVVDDSGSPGANVNSSKALETTQGIPTRVTYIASSGALSCNAANGIAIESAAGTGFKLVSWCANTSEATAGTGINVVVRRATAASSGGTTLTAEGTGTSAISKMDPGAANYGGVARGGALTPGTAGATLDQISFITGEIGTGAETTPSYSFCKYYGVAGEQMPTVSAGTANGLSIMLSATGAGGLSFCSVSATIIAE
jgi:hypothetical protein